MLIELFQKHLPEPTFNEDDVPTPVIVSMIFLILCLIFVIIFNISMSWEDNQKLMVGSIIIGVWLVVAFILFKRVYNKHGKIIFILLSLCTLISFLSTYTYYHYLSIIHPSAWIVVILLIVLMEVIYWLDRSDVPKNDTIYQHVVFTKIVSLFEGVLIYLCTIAIIDIVRKANIPAIFGWLSSNIGSILHVLLVILIVLAWIAVGCVIIYVVTVCVARWALWIITHAFDAFIRLNMLKYKNHKVMRNKK